jgi:hypothetical protein
MVGHLTFRMPGVPVSHDISSHGLLLVVVLILAEDVPGRRSSSLQSRDPAQLASHAPGRLLRRARSPKSRLVVKYPIISCLARIWQHRCP